MAAPVTAACESMLDDPFVILLSDGVTLSLRPRRKRRLKSATRFKDHLDVTLLISRPDAVVPPRITDFPMVKGTIYSAKGRSARTKSCR
jgi:hypothetical protein